MGCLVPGPASSGPKLANGFSMVGQEGFQNTHAPEICPIVFAAMSTPRVCYGWVKQRRVLGRLVAVCCQSWVFRWCFVDQSWLSLPLEKKQLSLHRRVPGFPFLSSAFCLSGVAVNCSSWQQRSRGDSSSGGVADCRQDDASPESEA
jgi:hypothetical protein